MIDRKPPKSYDEVLKIATNAHMTKVAANAKGGGGNSNHKRPTEAVTSTPVSTGDPRGYKSKTKSVTNRGDPPRAFDCFYCHQRHTGGWRECNKRRFRLLLHSLGYPSKENPDWTPRSDRTPSGASSNSRTSDSPISPNDSNSSMQSSASEKYFRIHPSL